MISSRDLTFLYPDDDDQRRGDAMIEARWGRGGYALSALWLPEFRPNRYPSGRQMPGVFLLGARSSVCGLTAAAMVSTGPPHISTASTRPAASRLSACILRMYSSAAAMIACARSALTPRRP